MKISTSGPETTIMTVHLIYSSRFKIKIYFQHRQEE